MAHSKESRKRKPGKSVKPPVARCPQPSYPKRFKVTSPHPGSFTEKSGQWQQTVFTTPGYVMMSCGVRKSVRLSCFEKARATGPESKQTTTVRLRISGRLGVMRCGNGQQITTVARLRKRRYIMVSADVW